MTWDLGRRRVPHDGPGARERWVEGLRLNVENEVDSLVLALVYPLCGLMLPLLAWLFGLYAGPAWLTACVAGAAGVLAVALSAFALFRVGAYLWHEVRLLRAEPPAGFRIDDPFRQRVDMRLWAAMRDLDGLDVVRAMAGCLVGAGVCWAFAISHWPDLPEGGVVQALATGFALGAAICAAHVSFFSAIDG